MRQKCLAEYDPAVSHTRRQDETWTMYNWTPNDDANMEFDIDAREARTTDTMLQTLKGKATH